MTSRIFIIIGMVLFVLLPMVQNVQAATLMFDPSTVEVAAGNSFSVDIDEDAIDDEIAGTDIYISFDSDYLELASHTVGSYFPDVNVDDSAKESGDIYISGLIQTQDDPVLGAGTVATLTFTAVQEGETDVSFECGTDAVATSKIIENDVNGTNLLECTSLSPLSVTITDSDGSTNPTPTTNGNGGDSPSVLPQSGILDNVIYLTLAGVMLFLVGAGLRMVT